MKYAKLIVALIVGFLIYLMVLNMYFFFKGQPKDFPNEPDGFLGISWGTPLQKVRDEMIPANNETNPDFLEFFYRKDWPQRWEIFDVTETVYMFSRKPGRQLNKVWVNFPIEKFDEMAQYCLKLWGNTPRKEYRGRPYYEWKGTVTTISLGYDVIFPEKLGTLYFYSTEYQKIKEEREKRK